MTEPNPENSAVRKIVLICLITGVAASATLAGCLVLRKPDGKIPSFAEDKTRERIVHTIKSSGPEDALSHALGVKLEAVFAAAHNGAPEMVMKVTERAPGVHCWLAGCLADVHFEDPSAVEPFSQLVAARRDTDLEEAAAFGRIRLLRDENSRPMTTWYALTARAAKYQPAAK